MKIFSEFKGTSNGNELNKKDWKRWLRNLFLFSLPAILAILIALQGAVANPNHLPTTEQLIFAFGAGYQALISSLIDLFQKYKSENR